MRPISLAFVLTATAFVAAAAACGDDGARACRVGADCASGMCSPEGQCVDGPGASTSGGPGGDADGGASTDGSTANDSGSDGKLPGCVPNKDGTILREEVPIQAGLHATFRVAKDEDVSTAGTPIAGGRRAWDFSGALASDENVLVETLELKGKWYEAKFTGASYTTRLSQSSDLVGVFETSPGALTLRGVVSPDDGLYRTELKNDPPVTTLAFPLEMGSEWTSDVSVSGVANGVVLLAPYSEKYVAKVDASGELTTPLGKFDVLRVRIDLTRTVGLLVTTIRTFAFVTECYGTVASVTSEDNESNVEFTRASELRRIAP